MKFIKKIKKKLKINQILKVSTKVHRQTFSAGILCVFFQTKRVKMLVEVFLGLETERRDNMLIFTSNKSVQ